MPENTKVHAPYNFVPFSNKHIERYACAEDLPRHDLIDPDLKSGEIYITLRAETPVFVSDGRKGNEHFSATLRERPLFRALPCAA